MITSFKIKSEKSEAVIDITEKIQDIVSENGFDSGLCAVFAAHTTCALTTADLDPGTDRDMMDAFRKMIPDLNYRHPHDPSHVGDHIMATMLGPSAVIPVQGGKLTLGTWQRVVMVEFNGPRERDLTVTCIDASS